MIGSAPGGDLDSIVRIGDRLFNLEYVTSIEPSEDEGPSVIDVHIVPGRRVRLRGDDAKAAKFFVSGFDPLPVDRAAQDEAARDGRAAQDSGATWGPSPYGQVDDTRS